MNYSEQQLASIKDQAQDWVVELASSGVSAEELQRFQQWIEADPVHKQLFNDSQRVWESIQQMEHLAALTPADALLDSGIAGSVVAEPYSRRNNSFWSRYWVTGAAVAAAAALLLAFIAPGLFESDGQPAAEAISTQIAEIRDLALPDGSIVTLGAKSGIQLDFSDRQRRLVLTNGEAFFSVTPDASRPFIVDAGAAVVRVVGTQFDVRQGAQQVRVAVLEGAVEVKSTAAGADGPSAERLTAGEQVIALRGGLLTGVTPVTGSQPGGWRSGRLFYEGTALSEVIADANRYYREKIVLMPESLGELKITASFRTEKIDQMLNTLKVALPVEITPVGANVILIKPALE